MPSVNNQQSVVLVGSQSGLIVIPRPAELTRLHYFDGKFLRSEDLRLEQRYLRRLLALPRPAGSPGVVHGFHCVRGLGDAVEIGAGLAVDGEGRSLLLSQDIRVDLGELLPTGPTGAPAFYLLVVCHAEALCGEDDVFGRLCEEACVTGVDRPYVVEGVAVRAVPLSLAAALKSSGAVQLTTQHLRSRVASAYFAEEQARIARAGLESGAWCLGAEAAGGSCVPLALLGRSGSATLFLDAWTVRRELMERAPRKYWYGRLAMRPWNVFLAQVLQFQCQLNGCVSDSLRTDGEDPCADAYELIQRTSETLAQVLDPSTAAAGGTAADGPLYSTLGNTAFTNARAFTNAQWIGQLQVVQAQLDAAASSFFLRPRNRLLIHCGIVETPSAGYLPVIPSSSVTVQEQVRRWFGEGVDLRFCVVRPDFVPHALEEARHMDRICLLRGLDDPGNLEEVDVLVPNGDLVEVKSENPGTAFESAFQLLTFEQDTETEHVLQIQGAARGERLASGGAAIYAAGVLRFDDWLRASIPPGWPNDTVFDAAVSKLFEAIRLARNARGGTSRFISDTVTGPSEDSTLPLVAFWMTLRSEKNIATLEQGTTPIGGRWLFAVPAANGFFLDAKLTGFVGVQQNDFPQTRGRIEANFSGELTFQSKDPQPVHTSLQSPLEIEFRLPVPETGWDVWSSERVSVRRRRNGNLKLSFDALWSSAGFVGLDLKEDPTAVQTGSASYDRAVEALTVLDSLVANEPDVQFSMEEALEKLLPWSDLRVGEAAVVAKHDWVFFHRRRTKVCGRDCPAPPKPEPVEVTCQEVYRLVLPTDGVEPLLRDIRGGDAVTVLNRLQAQKLGTVQFEKGTDTVFRSSTAPVVRAWAAAGGGTAFQVVTIAEPEDPTAPQPDATVKLYLDQAAQIRDSVPASVPQPPFPVDPEGYGAPCPAITVVLAEPQVQPGRTGQIFLWEDLNGDALRTVDEILGKESFGSVEFASDGTLVTKLQASDFSPFGDVLRRVELAPREDPPLPGAEKRLDSLVKAFTEIGFPPQAAGIVSLQDVERQFLNADTSKEEDIIFLLF